MNYSHLCFCLALLLIIHVFTTTTTFVDQDVFLSLSCGGTTSFVDALNISWVPDDPYVTKGNITSVTFAEGNSSSSQVPLRFFPNSQEGRKCYRIPVQNVSSTLLVRPQFYYKNYDGLGNPPAFSVSLGTTTTTVVNLTSSDPWIEEFIWHSSKETLSLCLQSIPNSGYPVISSLEIRPLPQGAYGTGLGDFSQKSLRKSYRLNCGYSNGSMRYPVDSYDRIWDADQYFSPSHLSTGFNIELPLNISNLRESPPVGVLQSARVLARKNHLSYNFPLDKLGDYHIVLYFAGFLPVSPTFDILINGNVVSSNFTVKTLESNVFSYTREEIRDLNITLRNINYYPQVNAIESQHLRLSKDQRA